LQSASVTAVRLKHVTTSREKCNSVTCRVISGGRSEWITWIQIAAFYYPD